MFLQNIKSSIKRLSNNKLYTFINFGGLALSLAVAAALSFGEITALYFLNKGKIEIGENYDVIIDTVNKGSISSTIKSLKSTSKYIYVVTIPATEIKIQLSF